MKLSSKDLKHTISNKSDQEIYDILFVHRSEYTAEVIEMAREQFRARRMAGRSLDELVDAGEMVLEREDAPLKWPLRLIAFFFSTVFFGIPVMLAHRHYVERGDK